MDGWIYRWTSRSGGERQKGNVLELISSPNWCKDRSRDVLGEPEFARECVLKKVS